MKHERRSRGLLLAGLLELALSASCAGNLSLRGRPDPELWSQVDTPHFTLATNMDPDAALDVARDLERTRAGMLAAAWDGGSSPRGRTRVVAFARHKELERYIGNATLSGLASRDSMQEPLIAFTPGRQSSVPDVIVHELAHDLSHWYMPLQPPWFAEGLAVYLETLRCAPESGLTTMGEPSSSSSEWLGRTGVFLRSSSLFAASTALHEDPRQQASFYASSWLLVHYLMDREAEAFGRFQLGLTRFTPWKQAWDDAFPGLRFSDLDDRVVAYARQGHFLVLSGNVQLPNIEPHLQTLHSADVHGILARLSQQLAPEQSERELKEALRLDPNQLDALVTQYRTATGDAQRGEIARRAVAQHPESADAWLLAAATEPAGDTRYQALQRAEKLADAHPGVERLLAEEELRRGHARTALEHTGLALRRAWTTPELLAVHVAALAAEHECIAAEGLAISAENLLPADCQLRPSVGGEPLGCGELVRRTWQSLRGTCNAGPLRTTRNGGGPG